MAGSFLIALFIVQKMMWKVPFFIGKTSSIFKKIFLYISLVEIFEQKRHFKSIVVILIRPSSLLLLFSINCKCVSEVRKRWLTSPTGDDLTMESTVNPQLSFSTWRLVGSFSSSPIFSEGNSHKPARSPTKKKSFINFNSKISSMIRTRNNQMGNQK